MDALWVVIGVTFVVAVLACHSSSTRDHEKLEERVNTLSSKMHDQEKLLSVLGGLVYTCDWCGEKKLVADGKPEYAGGSEGVSVGWMTPVRLGYNYRAPQCYCPSCAEALREGLCKKKGGK